MASASPLCTAAAVAIVLAAAAPARASEPVLGGCQVFPASSPANRGTEADWNLDVSQAAVDPRSADYVDSIGAGLHLHPDFGSNPAYGIPFRVVAATQPGVRVRFTAYGEESDPGPYPIPGTTPVEADSDRHVLVAQQGGCKLYELFGARYNKRKRRWDAANGATFDLGSGALRPEGWTSADAAGLPILPGLVRYDEVATGEIEHALRVTVARTQRAYLHPATHYASSDSNANLPPMGLRLRLRPGYDVACTCPQTQVILTALKRYGMIVADNGSSWFVSGETSAKWDDDDLDALKSVPASAFEAVDTGQALHTR